jgi:hypothetical protein
MGVVLVVLSFIYLQTYCLDKKLLLPCCLKLAKEPPVVVNNRFVRPVQRIVLIGHIIVRCF